MVGGWANLEKKNIIFLVSLISILLVSLFSVNVLLSIEKPQGEEYKALAEQRLNEAKEEFEKITSVSVREVTLEVVNESWVIENWGVAYIDHEEITIEELAKLVKKLAKSNSEVVYIPYDDAYEEGFEDMRKRVPDISKIQKLTGYKPTINIEGIIRSVIEYYRNK